ncbi:MULTISPECIES: SPFH domain-containing protein [Gordonia]|uniref:Flotillin n=1 Tax=Gordonia amicalis TaxID=89053 RepID=A0AAE4R2Y7_9ACTN|nr:MULTISPECIES: flotillin [Gordonia]ATD69252.1 flotillin [Gordonia sp. 1D]MCZ4579453.1 flotillin [Gordonia amicalis]MDJ0452044.1 flotillin [Gordonia amicalis]MDV6308114.1 flotillin [Gordonia amicalis]MDV6312074.1 flotillin [Gordonia amicalis]
MLGYYVPEPDEAMLISGAKAHEGDAPFVVIVGHGKWVMPFFRKVRFLSMALHEASIREVCVTTQGIQLNVRAVIAHKVGNDVVSIVNAGQRFISEQENEMNQLTGQIFSGHLRSIVGSMTVEQIIRERDTLARQVLEASKREMGSIGLVVDSFQIQSIHDMDSGYINALAAPNIAKVQREAAVERARADQESAKAQQESLRNQADYERETAIKRAAIKAETDKANAEAAQAGPLAQARVNQEVIREQSVLAQAQAELREQELISEVVKPAEAEARRRAIIAEAEAEAKAVEIQSAAAAQHNRIALDQQLIEALPTLVGEVAKGLSTANLTVYNGAEGVNEIMTGVITQGAALLRSLQDQVAPTVLDEASDQSVNGTPVSGV